MLQRLIGSSLAAFAVLVLAQSANAAIITLNAVQDSSITDRPSSAGQRDINNNGLLLPVWNNNSSNSTNGRRSEVIFQFDLSGLAPGSTIVDAHLEYYDTGNGGPNGVSDQASAFVNDTYMVMRNLAKSDADVVVLNSASNVAFDKDGLHETNVTYNAYSAAANTLVDGAKRWLETSASSMNLSLASNNAGSQYWAAGSADASALNLLNTAYTAQGYVVFLSWLPPAGQYRTFGDKESGNPPKLVLNVVPEPASIVLAVVAMGATIAVGRRLRFGG